jgi:hypothetical protein
MSTPNPIPANVQAVIELFDEALEDVTFPGVDQHTFLGHMDAVRAQAAEIEAARVALEDARRALDVQRSALMEHARLGLAYAQIFAQGDAELLARVESICLEDATSQRGKKRRRRKAEPSETPLQLMAVR